MSTMPIASTKYCFQCASPMDVECPDGDTHERYVCKRCGYIAYQNPKILVACIATWQDKLLLIKRGIEPAKGLWSVPAGFMECGETPEEAAARELYEETGARIDVQSLKLYIVGSLPAINEVYLVYRGELTSPECHTTQEAMEVKFFDLDDPIPIEKAAFPQVADAMDNFPFEHRSKNYSVYSSHYDDGKHTVKKIV
ncbi:NUDIX hydrolase [Pseudomaricurvus alkylphenolicus]|uniref:NUDIX hydrolase n=1 Tax=Pseudomaricurvus alkylphenolicus TaxID=1306991 RepID=UPI0030B881A1